jgi:diguanylate cyclase (GGDEF)-like protein/PAS domain S-box-containing protein
MYSSTRKHNVSNLLADSFEELHDIFWNAPIGIYKSTPEGRFLTANLTWAKMCGFDSPQELMESITDIGTQLYGDPEKREAFKRLLEHKGQVVEHEFKLHRPDGSTLWVAENVRAVRDTEERITHYLVMSFDISKRKKTEEEIKQKNEEQALLLDCIPTQLWYSQDADTYGAVNQAHADFLGRSKEAIQNQPRGQLLAQDEARACRESNLQVYATRKPCSTKEWMHNAQGEQRLLAITKTPKLDAEGNVEYVVCSAIDITEQRQAEIKLQKQEEWLRHILSVSPIITYTLDPEDLSVTWVSPNIYNQLGYTQYEALKPGWWYDGVHEEDRIQALHNFSKLFTQGEVVHEYRFITKDGSVIWVQDHLRLILDEQRNAREVVGAWTDITDRKDYEQQLKDMSLHDQLTGLYNRNFLENELARLNKSRDFPISVICMDLDGLKLVNDTLGHTQGDEQLKACAQVLRESFRASDIVARVGGDEFTALLPQTNLEAGETILKRIQAMIDNLNQGHQWKIPLGLSIGLACAEEQGQDLNQTFKQADDLMYRDKLNRDINSGSQIMEALMAALEERDFTTSGHAHRLEELCLEFGNKLGLNSNQLSALNLLSQVHDIGKMGIPDHILFKPGPLDELEWRIMRQHPEKGYRIAQKMNDLAGIADLILKHHERWDGKGYPLGLAGDDIPIECRILAIVDSFEAMTNDRPYRRAISVEEALAEIKRCAGSQFDPYLVEQFMEIMEFEV